MRKKLLIALLLAPTCSLASESDESYFLNLVHKDVSFDWSIDNSHTPGHPSKASEIIWTTQVPVIEVGKRTNFVEHKFYFGMVNDGKMTDEDWELVNGDLNKWSSTESDAEYFQLGYDYQATLFRFRDVPVVDYINTYVKNGLQYESWEATGSTDKLNGGTKYSGTTVMKNRSLWLKTSLGAEFIKTIDKLTFKLGSDIGLHAVYNVDQHPLREDLEDDSFVIWGGYMNYRGTASVSYKLQEGTSIDLGYTYDYSKNLSDIIEVNYTDESGLESRATNINSSTKTESSIYLGVTHNL